MFSRGGAPPAPPPMSNATKNILCQIGLRGNIKNVLELPKNHLKGVKKDADFPYVIVIGPKGGGLKYKFLDNLRADLEKTSSQSS